MDLQTLLQRLANVEAQLNAFTGARQELLFWIEQLKAKQQPEEPAPAAEPAAVLPDNCS
jgi:hypothetical protein